MSIHVLYMSYTLTSLRMFIGPYLHALMYNMLMHLIQNPWIHWMTELDCTSINTFLAALGKRNMERASIWRTLSRVLATNYHLYPLQHQGHPHLSPSNVLFFLCVLLVRFMAFCSPSACRGWDLALNSSTSFSVWMSKQSLQERSMQHGPPVSMKQNKHFFLFGKALLSITKFTLHNFVTRRDPPSFHKILWVGRLDLLSCTAHLRP